MSKKTMLRRLLALVLTLAMLAGLGLTAFAAKGEEPEAASAEDLLPVKGGAKLPPQEEKDPDEIVRVSIFLEKPAALDQGYSVKGISKNADVTAYRTSLKSEQQSLTQRIEREALGGKKLDVVWNLTLVANAISANVRRGDIDAIKAVSGVADVREELQYEPAKVSVGGDLQPNMAVSGEMNGAQTAWDLGYTGAGRRIAIIDTGIDIDHQSFDPDAFTYSLGLLEEDVDILDETELAAIIAEHKSDLNALQRSSSLTAHDLYRNAKVPFGYNYVDRSLEITHLKDQQSEHGSHVAGIAAGNRFVDTNGDKQYEDALSTVYTAGNAPDAQLLVMKVFGSSGGAYEADYMVAIEDAIVLGADAVNLSLGSANAGLTTNSEAAYQETLDGLAKSGLVALMSAGNDGSWAENTAVGQLYSDGVNYDTVGTPASFANSMAVASVDNDGLVGALIEVNGKKSGYSDTNGTYNLPLFTSFDKTPDGSGTEYPFVMLDVVAGTEGGGNEAEAFDEIASEVKDRIAVAWRGETSFYEKAEAAETAGAIGVIIANNTSGTINMDLSTYSGKIPAVSTFQSFGQHMWASGEVKTSPSGLKYVVGTVKIYGSVQAVNYESPALTMSDFSAWGVPSDLSLKPEITAPGGSIYSVWGANVTSDSPQEKHNAYELMSGTSMAAPQVTGIVALLQQRLNDPDNGLTLPKDLSPRTLAQALLMGTAVPIRDEYGDYYPVFQQGAGLVNAANAVSTDTLLLMDGKATPSAADGKVKAELGDDPEKKGEYGFSFTIYNMGAEEHSYTLSTDLFTQAIGNYPVDEEGNTEDFLEAYTVLLSADVSYTVGGKPFEAKAIAQADVNRDGLTNAADAQAILNYLVTGDDSGLNLAAGDLDGDGACTSYDAHLILSDLQTDAFAVPANGNVKVDVQIKLNDESLADYPAGAYLEGYTYVTPMSTEEGELGVKQSIPIFGFYGNWTSSSMFDLGSPEDWNYGTWERVPYMAAALDGYVTNVLVANGAMAFNGYGVSKNSEIESYAITPIRNVGNSVVRIFNKDTGAKLWQSNNLGSLTAPYYYANTQEWEDVQYEVPIGWKPGADLAEGTTLTVELILAPEYYAKYDYNWDNLTDGKAENGELGEGAFLRTELVVDSEAPVISNEKAVTGSSVRHITADVKDNLSLTSVTLYNGDGEFVYGFGPRYYVETEDSIVPNFDGVGPGVVYNADFDGYYEPMLIYQLFAGINVYEKVAELDDDVYTIVAEDSAGNQSSKRVYLNVQPTTTASGITLSDTNLELLVGSKATLTANVQPNTLVDRGVTWESDQPQIASVDKNTGEVTALAVGEAKITATTNSNGAGGQKLTAECTVKVSKLGYTATGVLADKDGNTRFFEWNFETGGPVIDDSVDFAQGLYPNVATAKDANSFYLFNTQASMYEVDRKTGEQIGQPTAWSKASPTPWSMTYNTAGLHWTYGSYIMVEDNPMQPTYLGFDFEDDLMGAYFHAVGVLNEPWEATVSSGTYQGEYQLIVMDTDNYVWTILPCKTADGRQTALFGYAPSDLEVFPDLTDNNLGNPYVSLYPIDDVSFLLSVGVSESDTCEVYYMTYQEAGEDSYWSAKAVGTFGEQVWPAYFFDVKKNDAAGTGSAPKPKMEYKVVEAQTFTAEDFEKVELNKTAAKGSLNAIALGDPAAEEPQEGIIPDTENNTLTVNLSVSDTTNNRVDLTYDAELLTLVSAQSKLPYHAIDAETPGEIHFAFASKEELNAPMLELVFHYEEENEPEFKSLLKLEVLEDGEPENEPVSEEIELTLHQHKLEAVPAKAATCTADGNIAYWYCPDCGKYYSDPEAKQEISKDDTVLKRFDCPTASYVDNPKSEWYHDVVDYMVRNKYMGGTNVNVFSPEDTLTRAELVTILYRIEGSPAVSGATKFTDIVPGRFYYDPVRWAEQNGVVNGVTPTTFEPESPITREQIATILYRYLKAEPVSENHLAAFSDGASVSDYAKDAMNWAVSVGLFNGDHGRLLPLDNATRAEIAAVLMRWLEQ